MKHARTTISLVILAVLLAFPPGVRSQVPTVSSPAGAFTPTQMDNQPGSPASAAVLWDQPLSGSNPAAWVDQDFPDMPTFSAFLADDFTNTEAWNISTIFVPGDGWNGFSSLSNATSLSWVICADNGGQPDCIPGGGGNPPLWSISLAPTDAQVTITNGSPGGYPSNAQLDLATPVAVPAGTWWLMFYPNMPYDPYGQYGRQLSETVNGAQALFINPGGGWSYGTDWQSIANIGAAAHDLAFRLEGEAGCLTDGDCDDGLFCNGEETCSAGECFPGFAPCFAYDSCNEATDLCWDLNSDGAVDKEDSTLLKLRQKNEKTDLKEKHTAEKASMKAALQ